MKPSEENKVQTLMEYRSFDNMATASPAELLNCWSTPEAATFTHTINNKAALIKYSILQHYLFNP